MLILPDYVLKYLPYATDKDLLLRTIGPKAVVTDMPTSIWARKNGSYSPIDCHFILAARHEKTKMVTYSLQSVMDFSVYRMP